MRRELQPRGLIFFHNIDEDFNGIVDGSEEYSYQIYSNGEGITIQTTTGRSYNDYTNSNWDVIAAAEADDGFAILRAGTSLHRLGQYRIWHTDNIGQITSGTSWQSGQDLMQQGYENLFNIDLDNNGQIGEPPPETNDDYDNTTSTNGYLEVGGTTEGTLEVTGDRDWLRINLVAGNLYSFAVEGQTLDDTYLRLYNSSGNLSEENDDYNSLNSAINNYQATITGDYYLGVGAFADAGTGSYVVSANNNGQIGEPPPETNDDYDNTTSTNGYLEVGGTTQGTLEVTGDRDWLRINLVAGNVYSFSVEGQTLNDTYLRLYDSIGNLLEENDDYNSLNSAINNYQATITGDYYLGVGAFADAGTGSYVVSANNNGQIGEPPPETNDDYDNTTSTNGYLEVGGTTEGTLEVTGDRDWLRINLVAGNVYSFAVEGQTLNDTYLRLYDSNGNLLEENDDYNSLNSAINNYQATITGDYYLGVGAFADAGTGSYVVSANNNGQIGEPPPETNDDYDNTTSTNGYLEVGGTTEGTLEVTGDRDWLRINLVADNVYSFAVEGQTLNDTYLRLYDSNGNLLEENDDYNSLNSAINNYQATITGDYYLGVGAFADAGTGNYVVSANNNGQIGEPPPETNDDYDNTTSTNGYLEVGGTTEGTLEVTGDRDWLRINLVADNVYSFAVEGQTLNDTYLRLYDSNGNLLEENDDYNSLNSAINNYQATITGDYYLGVGAFADAGTGNYVVSANNNGQIGEPPPETNDDYDNTTSTNGYLEVGGTTEGTLEVTGDRDWLRINLVAGNVYSFAVEGQTLDDTYLRLYDSNGNLLEENDDYNSLNSSINNYQATITGDYYLGVGAFADAGTGSYVVSANKAPSQPPGYSSSNGYGQINIQRAFEQHLNISLAAVDELGGNYWTLDNIYAPEVWSRNEDFAGATGFGTVVAVIDTGVDLDHREFAGRIIQGYDFVDNDLFADDGNGHGTHVAGTIAGAYDDFGVTGVAFDSQIMPIRVLDDEGTGYTSDIISGIRFAADNNSDVINLSLGGGGYSQSMADAIEYATNLGSLVVMAAGNTGGISPEYPAAHAANYGLAVGAVDQYENLASFSNLAGSTTIDYVTAPGVDVYSSIPGDSYAFYSGTSMATPHVAGAAALLRGYDPNLTAESIEDLLTGTASNSINNSSINYLSSANIMHDELTNYNGYITAENISNINPEELAGTFVGRASDTFQLSNFLEIDNLSISANHQFETLTSNLYALNLDGSMDSHAYVSELLDQNQFEYFEINRTWEIV